MYLLDTAILKLLLPIIILTGCGTLIPDQKEKEEGTSKGADDTQDVPDPDSGESTPPPNSSISQPSVSAEFPLHREMTWILTSHGTVSVTRISGGKSNTTVADRQYWMSANTDADGTVMILAHQQDDALPGGVGLNLMKLGDGNLTSTFVRAEPPNAFPTLLAGPLSGMQIIYGRSKGADEGLYFLRQAGSGWSDREKLPISPLSITTSPAAVDHAGNLHVLGANSEGTTVYATNSSGSWKTWTIPELFPELPNSVTARYLRASADGNVYLGLDLSPANELMLFKGKSSEWTSAGSIPYGDSAPLGSTVNIFESAPAPLWAGWFTKSSLTIAKKDNQTGEFHITNVPICKDQEEVKTASFAMAGDGVVIAIAVLRNTPDDQMVLAYIELDAAGKSQISRFTRDLPELKDVSLNYFTDATAIFPGP